jgi:hypothetical protein
MSAQQRGNVFGQVAVGGQPGQDAAGFEDSQDQRRQSAAL